MRSLNRQENVSCQGISLQNNRQCFTDDCSAPELEQSPFKVLLIVSIPTKCPEWKKFEIISINNRQDKMHKWRVRASEQCASISFTIRLLVSVRIPRGGGHPFLMTPNITIDSCRNADRASIKSRETIVRVWRIMMISSGVYCLWRVTLFSVALGTLQLNKNVYSWPGNVSQTPEKHRMLYCKQSINIAYLCKQSINIAYLFE